MTQMTPLNMNSLSQMIDLYSDGAEWTQFSELANNPAIKGFTTNPSLMRKAGVTNYKEHSLKMIQLLSSQKPAKPISFEVFSDDLNEMEKQASEIATWGANVFVKIPFQNTKGQSCIPLIKKLSSQKVQLNITALFTHSQTFQTIEAVQHGAPSIVSIFAGRIADSGVNPSPLVTAASGYAREMGSQIKVLWASTREVYNIVEAISCGCHIITAPPDILKKLKGVGTPLTDLAIDTVKTFKSDSEAAGFSL